MGFDRKNSSMAVFFGDQVNLELPLAAASRYDGHFVQGHVDAVVAVDHIISDPGEWVIRLSLHPELVPLIVPKGSVALSDVNRRVSIRFLAKEDARLVPYSGTFSFRGFFFKVRSLAEGN